MTEISIIKNQITKAPSQSLVEELMEELTTWDDKVGAKEIASTIKSLMSAETINNAWFSMKDNKVILDTVKLVLNMQWVKTGNWVNINLFNVNKPWKDEELKY